MNTLPIQRYQFNCQTKQALALNHYSGSMLRGAFGHALRALACVTGMPNCQQCMLYRQCSYPAIFEPPPPLQSAFQAFNHTPSPYIIEPPALGEQNLSKGSLFSFKLVLVGQRAIDTLPLIVKAWQKALQHGLGRQQSQVALKSVNLEVQPAVEQAIYQAEKDKSLHKVFVQLLTPLRIQRQKRILADDMQAKDFLNALVRRHYCLQEFYAPNYQAPNFAALALQAEQIQAKVAFTPYVMTRYSCRQKQKMRLDSVLGHLELSGDLSPFIELLKLGQSLHVGKNTTFGMGQYSIC